MNVTIYSKNGCPYCDKIKAVLEQRNISFVNYFLDVDFTRDEFYSEFGQGSTFPQVIIDTVHIGGCSDTVKYLSENNLI